MREINKSELTAAEQLSPGLQVVLIKAGQEAARLHYPTIGTEFLLLGLLQDDQVRNLLDQLVINYFLLYTNVRYNLMRINLNQKKVRGGKSFSVSVNQFVAEAAKAAADQQRPASTLDVLAVLVEKGQSDGIKLLRTQGLTREKIDQLRSSKALQS